MLGFLIAILCMGFGAYLLYAYDKQCAERNKWRIPESMLLFVAAVGGSIGAYMAMRVYHHKTRKEQFAYGIPAIILIQTIILTIISNT